MPVEGLITFTSPHLPQETLARLKAGIVARPLSIFAEIDHSAGAQAVGLALRPLVLLIFGAAKGGTPFMQAAATAGIDLPLKLLVWQDMTGATQVSYNDPGWVARRHGLGDQVAGPLDAMSALLRALVMTAVAE